MRIGALYIVFSIFFAQVTQAAPSFSYVTGSAQKICQLTGDFDKEWNRSTLNQTSIRAGVEGTDLGFSFEHHGKLFFLFGDTTARPDLKRKLNEDVIASVDPSILRPDQCVPLTIITDPIDGGFHSPRIPHVSNATYEVPAGGVSANDKMYVYFTDGTSDEKLMHRSYLGVSSDDGINFSKVYEFSQNHFINVTPVKVNTEKYAELPTETESTILLFGSGWYRKSDAYLSVVDESNLDQKNKIRYFAGLDGSKKPRWSEFEKDSAALFHHACLGEFSVTFDEHLQKWIMLYNCDSKRGINMRVADKPWGPWSASQIIFEPNRDGAYGTFMHIGYEKPSDKKDDLSDPGHEEEWGGEYGPYMIPRMFTSNGDEETIVYTLSIHNPYQTILMKSTIKMAKSVR